MVEVFSITDMSEFPINHYCGDFKRLLDSYQIFGGLILEVITLVAICSNPNHCFLVSRLTLSQFASNETIQCFSCFFLFGSLLTTPSVFLGGTQRLDTMEWDQDRPSKQATTMDGRGEDEGTLWLGKIHDVIRQMVQILHVVRMGYDGLICIR